MYEGDVSLRKDWPARNKSTKVNGNTVEEGATAATDSQCKED